MTEPHPSRDEALNRFDARYAALAKANQRKPAGLSAESGAGAGYRVLGELIGGVLTGLGLGWLVDRLAGTHPFGLICGLLIGMGVSIGLIVRSAGRMSGVATKRSPPAAADGDDGAG